MEPHQIKRCMVQMFLLAGPGVLLSTFFLGSAIKLAFPYDWSWKTSLLLGGVLSATGPVAIVALLKELGASKKLTTLIEGESMMNDGMAIVVYQLFYQMVLGRTFSLGGIVKYLIQVSLGAVGIGLAFWVSSFMWLGFIFNDTVIEITLTLAVSYIAYFTAQDGADSSGILTVMTLGMLHSSVARKAFKSDGQQSLRHFWEMVAYVANTLIFILSGVVIAEGVLNSKRYFENHGTLWGYLILLFNFVQVSRAIVVGLFYPLLKYFGYGLDWKEATILSWSGLRGPVSLLLSLSIKDFGYGLDWKEATILSWSGLRGPVSLLLSLSIKRATESSSFLSQDTGILFPFFTGRIVFLTLTVNGSTAQCILYLLQINKLSEGERHILDYTRSEMMNKALCAFSILNDDEELGPTDWPTVEKYLTCLDNLEGDQVHTQAVPGSEKKLDALTLEDVRIRFLNGVQAAYWGMLNEGRIKQRSVNIMVQSVDEALDLVSYESLCDWNFLRPHVRFPSYYKSLQLKFCPQKLVTYLMVERIEPACYICAAFLRAHSIARRRLRDFLGDSGITSLVINESEAEGEEARRFLEDVRVIFPQVLPVVKARQMTYSILKQLSDYVQNLEKVGLLKEKEMIHLHDVVQTDMEKLWRNSPFVKMPEISDFLRSHPFLGALPAMVREHLEGSTEELIKLQNVDIYREGSEPNGIWLISNGFVKWTSKSLRNTNSLHPMFSHGSSLGLYEVLIGKPYICNMTTDSVVHCFFIEAEQILSLLRSDPTLEGFFWKESVIVIAKILLPLVYEKMSMQELRAFLVESSIVNIYIRGENFDIPNHFVGFLLEGSIKSLEVQEPIRSPAALLPLVGELSYLYLKISGASVASIYHQGSGYMVQTRARVITVNMAALDGDGVIQNPSASQFSDPVNLHTGQTREHGATVGWSEYVYMPSKHQQHFKGTDPRENSSPARELQVNNGHKRTQLSRELLCKGSTELIMSKISEYPTGITNIRPLHSAQSEGTATVDKNLRAREFTGQGLDAPLMPTKGKQKSDVGIE